MARRLDIELTSIRDDGTWTWRAVGAKAPKGNLDGALVPDGVCVGDIVRVEADAFVEGLFITSVLPPKAPRKERDLLEMLGSGREEPLVTSRLRAKGRGRGKARDGERGRGKARDGERGRGKGRERRPREDRPQAPSRPKAPRLRPGRKYRQAALAALPDLQHRLADEVLKGGVPGVRQAVDKMNEKATAEGMPKVKSEPLVALAEMLAPSLKAAEWRDRAEAALVGIETVDVKDIRSVVVAADSGARDEATRDLADKLRDGLTLRVDAEHRKWLDELAENISEGRAVRALRLSSRPPKAGAPLPPDMAERLAAAASASLTSEVTQDRWATVLDAVAYSPVRAQVVPEGLPEKPDDQLLSAVRKAASKVPAIAAAFGVNPPARRKRGGRRPPLPPPPPLAAAVEVAGSVVEEPAETEARVAEPSAEDASG